MNAYLLLVFIIFFLWLGTKGDKVVLKSNVGNEKINSSVFLSLSFFMIFLLMALRGPSVGADTANYMRYFIEVANLEWRGMFDGSWNNAYYSTEIGYMIFEKLISLFSRNTQVILVCSAALYLTCIYYFVNKFCYNHILAISVFLGIGSFLLAMNVMRQGIAVGIVCLSWCKLLEKKYKWSIFLFLLATSFHVSAIIFLCFFVIHFIPANVKNFFICTLLLILVLLSGNEIIYRVLNFFPTYAYRYGRGLWNISEANGVIILWIIIAIIIVEAVFTVNWKKIENHFLFEVLILCLAYLGTQIIGQSFDGMQRLSMYFQPFLILLFEEGGKKIEGKMSKVYTGGVSIAMFLLFLRMASTSQYLFVPFWS